MKILVNDTEIEIFSGAKVKDALRKFSESLYGEVKKGKSEVKDKWNNCLELNGELSTGQRLFIKSKNKQEI